ncbi:MAG: alcohol dehydrogenase [Lentisphaerae bacterium]|nr:MAG: alcohol dehydrogenase [Lentisphaerota bacterium]
MGTRVGAGWFFKSCGQCQFCLSNRQNLCSHFEGTGRDAHGGFATHMLIPQQAAIPIPSTLEDHIAAPCLCAGAVGYRAWLIAVENVGTIDSIGFMGYGASAHLLTAFLRQKFPHIHIHVFARREESRRLARDTGAGTVTPPHEAPPSPLQAIIDTTPAWEPVIHALDFLQPGGVLVINAIAKESTDQNALMHIDYRRHLWMEKKLTTVANVTPRDLNEFLTLCGSIKLPIHVQTYAFDQLPQAIIDLRHSRGVGAKVLLTPP